MKSTIHLAVIALGALIQPLVAQTEVLLYDNVPLPLDWNSGSVYPEPGDSLIAQQFKTGALGLVSSISVPIGSDGAPSGVVPFEIWDDNNGIPGTRVASVGEIDIAALKPIDEGGQVVTFNTPITGLSPNSSYYVVSDVSNANLVDGTYGILVAEFAAGVNDADKFQVIFGGNWIYVWELLADVNYYRMTITENSADIPAPFEISSIVRTEASTTLSWSSQSGKTYVVEFSPDFSDGNWEEVDDSVAATGDETSYLDNDPERLLLTEGFYRVRKES